MKKSKVSALLISLLVVSSASSTAFAAELEQKAVSSESVMPTLQTPITQSDSSAKTEPVKIGDSTENPATEKGQTSQTDQGTTKPEVAPVQAQPNKDEAVTDAPVIEKPATEVPATEEPKVEKPSTEAPATEEPKAEKPATEVPSVDKPITEAPAEEIPATTEPAMEAPVVTAPAVEVPVVTAPAIEVPVVTAPAIEVPVMTTLTIKHVLYLDSGKLEREVQISNVAVGTEYDLNSNIFETEEIQCSTKERSILIDQENKMIVLEYHFIDVPQNDVPQGNLED